jgi:hypothetical protein
MNTIQVNNELEVKRDIKYQYIKNTYKRTKQSIKAHISNILASGKHFERNYSIRHDVECTQQENEYINSLADIEFRQYEQMYNELLRLQRENTILRQAVKKAKIEIKVSHVKYYGDTEQFN